MSDHAGAELVTRLFALLRTHELYPYENDTAVGIRREFQACLERFCRENETGQAALELYGDHFLINNRLVKPDPASLSYFTSLAFRFKQVRIRRLRFASQVSEEDLIPFLKALIEDWTIRHAPDAVTRLSLASIACLAGGEDQSEEGAEKAYQADLSNFMDLLSKMIATHARLFWRVMVEEGSVDFLLIRRMMQDFISAAHHMRQRSLGFLPLGLHDDREAVHGVLRALVAVPFAEALGLTRVNQEELGMACLYGAVGKERIALEKMVDTGGVGGAAHQDWKSAPMETFQALLPQGVFSPSMALLINTGAGLDFARAADHPFSKLLQVVRDYEALVQNKPFRLAMHPTEALKLLWRDRGSRYDGETVEAFIEFMGPRPTGSTWSMRGGYPLVVIDRSVSAAYKDGKWFYFHAEPEKPWPIHTFPVNPVTAFMHWG